MVPPSATIPNRTPSDDLLVVVAPESACDGIDPDDVHWLARIEDDGRVPPSASSDLAQLRAEIAQLERELDQTESHLDAVVTRNEQILAERTQSYQNRLAELDAHDGDDVLWIGRRYEPSGLLSRTGRWLSGLLD